MKVGRKENKVKVRYHFPLRLRPVSVKMEELAAHMTRIESRREPLCVIVISVYTQYSNKILTTTVLFLN